MKSRNISKSVLKRAAVATLWALPLLSAPALAETRNLFLSADAEDSAEICSKGSIFTWCNAGKAQSKATESATSVAFSNVKERCENGKSGKLSGEAKVFSQSCYAVGNEIVCKVVARATCAVAIPGTGEPKDRRVATSASRRARVLSDADGNQYLIDERGNAHPLETPVSSEQEGFQAGAAR